MDDSDTDQDKKDTIDFKRLLTEYRERTEDLIPHTMTRVEDVMFIDENRMIALEYVFYNKDGKYFHLEPSDNMHSELGVKDYSLGGSMDQDHKYKFEHPKHDSFVCGQYTFLAWTDLETPLLAL